MGYPVKLQKVERPPTAALHQSAAALADAVQLAKGEDLEWFIEDKNTLILVEKNRSNWEIPSRQQPPCGGGRCGVQSPDRGAIHC